MVVVFSFQTLVLTILINWNVKFSFYICSISGTNLSFYSQINFCNPKSNKPISGPKFAAIFVSKMESKNNDFYVVIVVQTSFQNLVENRKQD